MEDKIITLQSFYDPLQAQITLSHLQAAGISCFIADNNILDANPFYNQAVGGIKIKIFEHDLEKCREILDQNFNLDEAAMADAETTCPHCHSNDVERNPIARATAWHCLSCQQDFE